MDLDECDARGLRARGKWVRASLSQLRFACRSPLAESPFIRWRFQTFRAPPIGPIGQKVRRPPGRWRPGRPGGAGRPHASSPERPRPVARGCGSSSSWRGHLAVVNRRGRHRWRGGYTRERRARSSRFAGGAWRSTHSEQRDHPRHPSQQGGEKRARRGAEKETPESPIIIAAGGFSQGSRIVSRAWAFTFLPSPSLLHEKSFI